MRLDPRHLRIAVAIAEHGTFNKAAAALGMSQPALSKSISHLEKALGSKLFDRGKRGTALTDAGRILVRGAKNVEAVIAQTRGEIAANATGLEGPLSIGVTPSMTLGLLPRALKSLASKHPSMEITIKEGLDGDLIPALQRGEIDLLLGPLEPLSRPDKNMVEVLLGREPFLIGMPPHHDLAGRDTISVAEVAGEAWILPTPGSSFFRVVEALFLSAGVSLPLNVVRTNSLPLQEKLASALDRLILVTPAQLFGRKFDFVVVPLSNAPARSIGIRYPVSLSLSPLASALIQHLQAEEMIGLRPATGINEKS